MPPSHSPRKKKRLLPPHILLSDPPPATLQQPQTSSTSFLAPPFFAPSHPLCPTTTVNYSAKFFFPLLFSHLLMLRSFFISRNERRSGKETASPKTIARGKIEQLHSETRKRRFLTFRRTDSIIVIFQSSFVFIEIIWLKNCQLVSFVGRFPGLLAMYHMEQKAKGQDIDGICQSVIN